jgi:mannose/fructose/N-acetylgalactosamine-specific phosphotransferase system component IIB
MKTRTWLSTHWYSISLALCAGTFLFFALVFANINSGKSADCRKLAGTLKENVKRTAKSIPEVAQNITQAKNKKQQLILLYSGVADNLEKDWNELQSLKLKTIQSKQIQKNLTSQLQTNLNRFREALKKLESLPEEADSQTIKIASQPIYLTTPVSFKELQDYCPIEMKHSGLVQSQNPTPATPGP